MLLFHPNYLIIINQSLNNISITSTPQINVLGVIFNSKLLWTEQVSNTIDKANKSCWQSNSFQKFQPIENQSSFNLKFLFRPLLLFRNMALFVTTSSRALKLCAPSYIQEMTLKKLNWIDVQPRTILYLQTLIYYTLFTTMKGYHLSGSHLTSTRTLKQSTFQTIK